MTIDDIIATACEGVMVAVLLGLLAVCGNIGGCLY
jgi:hypothetical protein